MVTPPPARLPASRQVSRWRGKPAQARPRTIPGSVLCQNATPSPAPGLGRATGKPNPIQPAADCMKHQEDNPRYWNQWLQERGVTEAVTRHIDEICRSLRHAHRRMWTFAYVGAIGGATFGVLVAALFVRQATRQGPGSLRIALMALCAAAGASLVWWGVRRLMHRSQLRSKLAVPTGSELQCDDRVAASVIQTVSEGLARSQSRPADETWDTDQFTQATIFAGLRDAGTSDLERSLLERLVGSAFTPALDGGIFVFKLGPSCVRCQARTRTGVLRLLNVPGHWAATNGYQRLRDLPARARHLRVVPQRTQDLQQFLGKPEASVELPKFLGPKADVRLCETCGNEAIRLGVLQQRDR